jgi:hypothetical protein
MDEIITIITHAIFAGTCVIVPFLLVLHLFKLKLPLLDNSTIVLAVNITLLLGSSIFIAQIIIDFPIQYYSGGEYEQYTFTNRMVGPYWFYFWFIGAGIHGLSPQILWIKKLRSSFTSSVVIVSIWLLIFIAGLILAMRSDWNFSQRFEVFYPLRDVVTYLVIISIIYFVINRKMKLAKP